MGIRTGAEMTSFEFRFIPMRIKDAIAPTGEIAQWLRAPQINAKGEAYLDKYYGELGGIRMTTQDRLYATLLERRAGRGPCYLDLRGVDPKRLEWTIAAYLSMAPAAAMIMSDEAYYAKVNGHMAPIEVTGGEPLVVGGHGLSGYWVDTRRRTTREGLWAAGDVTGGCPKKYAPGAWAEAVLAVRDMINEARRGTLVPISTTELVKEQQRVFAPLAQKEGVDPKDLEERLQKIMDEYAGGIAVDYGYSEGELTLARLHLRRLSDDLRSLCAESSYGLMHAHEVIDRVTVAMVLVEHMLHRKETRWHCYQERLDYPMRDDARWMVFVNSIQHADGRIEMRERPVEREALEVVLPALDDGAVIRHA